MKNRKYGFKVCYSEKGKKQLIEKYFTAETYKDAQDIKNMNYRFGNRNSHIDDHKLYKPTWYVLPIKKYEIKKGIWKERPF